MLFDGTMTEFFWINVGRIRRQPFDPDFRMGRQIVPDRLGAMGCQAIPDQYKPGSHQPPHMLESDHDLGGVNRAVKMAFVDFAAQGSATT